MKNMKETHKQWQTTMLSKAGSGEVGRKAPGLSRGNTHKAF
jgi:hypothetical protein